MQESFQLKWCVCVCVCFSYSFSEVINLFLSLLHLISICLSPLFNFNFVLSFTSLPPWLHMQASRPVGVGFCDGNHGPRRPLCLQRSRKRGWLHERPRGANFSRAGHHWNHPQSFSGHIRVHLHLSHIKFSAWARDIGAVPGFSLHCHSRL